MFAYLPHELSAYQCTGKHFCYKSRGVKFNFKAANTKDVEISIGVYWDTQRI